MPLHAELSLSAQTAYAQLADVAMGLALERGIAHLHGSFSCKTVQGAAYWYFAFRDLDGRVRQLYVGPDNEAVRSAVERARQPDARPDPALAPLAKAAVALGCTPALPKHVRAVRRLADYGFFHAGGVLVGTHAFIALGNVLGVKWLQGGATTDVDFAHAGRNLSVALPADLQVDVHGALASFERGFIPMVQLAGGAGASYKLTGDPEFQIDFLTSLHRGEGDPVLVPDLNIALQPLRFMEFSLERVIQAVLIDRNGAAVLVSVPAPERFAIHKLMVAGERAGAQRTKANKDLRQAAALIEHLWQVSPDDLLAAWQDAASRGPGWRRRAREGLAAASHLLPALPLDEFKSRTPA